jgi:hypothetical protein
MEFRLLRLTLMELVIINISNCKLLPKIILQPLFLKNKMQKNKRKISLLSQLLIHLN